MAVEPIRIVLAADDDYAFPLAASVRSVLDNSQEERPLEVVVLSCGISAESKRRLSASWDTGVNGLVRFLDIDVNSLSAWPTSSPFLSHPSSATYARLLMPQLLPSDWDKVIYLDADTITLSPFDDLWELDLHGLPLGAVIDPFNPLIGSSRGVQCWEEAGLDPGAPYFNAGMLLINLDVWRRDQVAAKALAYVEEHADCIGLLDQEALNAVVNGKFLAVDESWNMMDVRYGAPHPAASGISVPAVSEAALRHPRVRHFTGKRKPWKNGYRIPDSADLFFTYADRTMWAGRRTGQELSERPAQ
ncbi:glycosyltransferase family 8 protein [Lentzea albidocapillata]|uniref:Lipopolysaccharide biosynthesis protein, LPS:glycosyltransferase n=1 Tax=Lentzea albidocapillata TaxID=40571 RepID=A0A1W2F8S8_9PSEU|nr:glycosyltransferase family 8 protein [Lentzea albidocapillata]SMD18321.1 Lipopolysaccharide biosynthesis protein, LPS:glycosyltransferase [Lentzea albidocapillata]